MIWSFLAKWAIGGGELVGVDPVPRRTAAGEVVFPGHLGRGAGRLRNVEMLESERPDIVLAYPDPESRGTWHCVAEAWRRRIPVLVWVSWLTGGEATRFVQRKVDERGVSLVRHRQGLLEDLALFDRDGRRVIITGSEQFVDQLPEELDG